MHGTIDGDTQRPVILVAEDEFLIACDLAETVEVAGFGVDGPYATLAAAESAAGKRAPDCALLDVDLADTEVFPLADRLQQADVPIVFHSGAADPRELAERYPGATVITKPCPPAQLLASLRSAVAA